MKSARFIFVTLSVVSAGLLINGQNVTQREGRLFSLFSLVRFDNFACHSNNQDGVCLTKKECLKKNGTVLQGCAMGYGVCCTFNLTCDGMTKEKSTTFQNSNYPGPETSGNIACIANVQMHSPDICQIRLDFDNLELLPPVLGVCEEGESIQVAANNIMNMGVDKLCGKLSGQHIYLQFSRNMQPSGVHILIRAKGRPTNIWRIRINQIDCSRESDDYLRAPEGCLQYFHAPMGFIRSFNFDSTGMTSYMAENDYVMCIRRPPTAQCVEYFSNMVHLQKSVSNQCGTLSVTGFLPKTTFTDFLVIYNDQLPSLFCGVSEGFQNTDKQLVTSITRSSPGPFQMRFLTDKSSVTDMGGFEIKYIVKDTC